MLYEVITGERIRDFLFLDSNFLRKNEEKLKGFDENLKIEYGLGVSYNFV